MLQLIIEKQNVNIWKTGQFKRILTNATVNPKLNIVKKTHILFLGQ